MSLCTIQTDALAHVEDETYQHISPVFHLPPETLAIIFTHGTRNYYESDDGGRFTTVIPTWVNISYVCCHWCNIAVNCPVLWTYPFHLSLRWTEELLLRSKEAPLKMSCIYPFHQHEEISWLLSLLDKLLKHSGHIQELRLYVPMSSLPVKLFLCSHRLEKLETNF